MKFFKKFGLLFFLTHVLRRSILKDADIKSWFKEVLLYGFAMETRDYTKYISKNYTIFIDGKTFYFSQWLRHIKNLKDDERISFNI